MVHDLESEILPTELSAEICQPWPEILSCLRLQGTNVILELDAETTTCHPQISVEGNKYIEEIESLHDYLHKVKRIVNSENSENLLKVAVEIMASVSNMLSNLSSKYIIPHSRM